MTSSYRPWSKFNRYTWSILDRRRHPNLLRHGYQGGYDTVKSAGRTLRKEAVLAELTQRRFETGSGEHFGGRTAQLL